MVQASTDRKYQPKEAGDNGLPIEHFYGTQLVVYSKQQPAPAPILKSARLLLHALSPDHLSGLGQIVLRRSDELSRRERSKPTKRRKGRGRIKDARGLYYERTPQRLAYAVIFVDRVLSSWPAFFFRIGLLRDHAVARTLYHEIGHHLHRTRNPWKVDAETAAEEWRRVLFRQYGQKRYWYALPALYVIRGVLRLLRGRRRGSAVPSG